MPAPEWPTVAVIVPVFNEAGTLPDHLCSLLELDYPAEKLEYLYVDNNSTDRSRKILENASGRVRVLSETRQGAAAARNCAIRNTQAEIIAFTDADCTVDRHWLKALVSPLASDPDRLACGGRILSKEPCNYIERFGEQIHDHRKAIEVYTPPYLITMNLAVARKHLLEIGLFDERLLRGQDSDLAFRLFASGIRFRYVDDAVVRHHNQETLSGLFGEGYKHGYWAVRVIEKHRQTLFSTRPKSMLHGAPRVFPLLVNFLAASLRSRSVARNELCDLAFRGGKKFGMLRSALDWKIDGRHNP